MADQGIYIAIGDASRIMGLSPKFLQAMSTRGELPPITRFGNRKFFKREQFQRALETLENSQPAAIASKQA